MTTKIFALLVTLSLAFTACATAPKPRPTTVVVVDGLCVKQVRLAFTISSLPTQLPAEAIGTMAGTLQEVARWVQKNNQCAPLSAHGSIELEADNASPRGWEVFAVSLLVPSHPQLGLIDQVSMKRAGFSESVESVLDQLKGRLLQDFRPRMVVPGFDEEFTQD